MGIPTLVFLPGGRGGVRGARPPALPLPRRLRPPRRLAGSSEWKEWVSASSYVLGNQMIRQEGVPPPWADAHWAPESSRRALAPKRRAPPPPLTPRGSPKHKACPEEARSRLQGGPPRAQGRGFGEGSCRCVPGGPVNETWVYAMGRKGLATGEGGAAALGHPRPAIGHELRARGSKTGRRIKRKCPPCFPETLSQCAPEMGEGRNVA